MNILALDLGTKMGVARNYPAIRAETIRLAKSCEVAEWGRCRANRRCDPRMIRLRYYLEALPRPKAVIFEDVEFSTYTDQTQLWASFRTTVWQVFSGRAIIDCVPVPTLKKFATGNHLAKKEHMAHALFTQRPELVQPGLDDNAVDALWILLWGEHIYARL